MHWLSTTESQTQRRIPIRKCSKVIFSNLISFFPLGMSDGFVMLMEDKDILVAHIEASKENVDGKISDKESEINRAISDDWKATENKIIDEQHHRNRTIVEEVINTCNNFRDEISKNGLLKFYSYSERIQKA